MGPRMLIALYDYNARENSDMSFRRGDRMELLDDRYSDYNFFYWTIFWNFWIFLPPKCSDADWWKAEHIPTGTVGYIPRNFVAMEQSIESYE